MRVQLGAEEVEVLDKVLKATHEERLRQIHHADSREYRALLEHEASLIEGIRIKLAGTPAVDHREEMIDEGLEETFPASDPPAHSIVSER